MSKEKIIVLGGKGLLGSHLINSLSHKWQPISAGKSEDNEIVFDVLSIQDWIKIFKNENPKTIINTYGYTNVDGCEHNINLAYKLNSLVPAVIQAAQKLCGKTIYTIHISTDQIYSGSSWYDEGMDPKPLNHYGKTKLLGESYLDINHTIILRTNFFGRSKSDKKISYTDWIFNKLKAKENICLHENVLFTPIHMNELAKIVIVAMEKCMTGVFNVGSTTKLSKLDFAVHFAETVGVSTKTIIVTKYEQQNSPIKRPTDMSLDGRKLVEASGVELMSLEQNIQLCANEYKFS
ncbi:sugar nucleotide-binding protein [Synechococcus sp. YX-04-1]|uniref:SDR family oxidoreductase n=1 Tax=Synechococcus sp. YX-04-1 TaxID=3062778 RepID=UPI0026E4078A|nr:sugar nucleotide-binding protein [Synechococcus sp. YX-04-1]MDO6351096.1 sugar nucleotide-binding protein [Synechococcus sp. YX-04-1]